MTEQKDNYREDDEENLSQVRSIIRKLNEEKPSQEQNREVVVRADGSRMVRVTKKRRVMLTQFDKRRKSRRQFLMWVAAGFLLLSALVAVVLFRMATMSSSAYMEQKCAEIRTLWGATDVKIEGAGVEGTALHLNSLVAQFPEDSMLQRVELNDIQAELEMEGFLTGKIKGENLSIGRAQVVLRGGGLMDMPRQQGVNLWTFRRVECKDFSISFAEDANAPLSLKNTQAYMYYPKPTGNDSVLMFKGGVLDIRSWKSVRLADGKAHISSRGVDDFLLNGTTDAATDEVETRRTAISFSGQILQGKSLCGPYATEASNMSLADFTDGRFEEFLTARTVSRVQGKSAGKFTMELRESGAPVFAGELHLKNICLSSFPALMAITEHLEHGKRRLYNPLMLNRGYLHLGRASESISVEMPEGAMVERDLASIRGKLVLNEANELSGELAYGVPVVLARVEYPDGHPDPIFQQQGEWAVLRTNLRGNGNTPGDDMAEVEARAAIARRDRPARIPFDRLDLNQITQQMLAPQNQQGQLPAEPVQPETPHAEPPAAPSRGADFPPLSNPFETNEDPFAPSTPF